MKRLPFCFYKIVIGEKPLNLNDESTSLSTLTNLVNRIAWVTSKPQVSTINYVNSHAKRRRSSI